MSCKGICDRYLGRKTDGMGHYQLGHKRCQKCELFIKFNGSRCPCCNCKLRTKPRALKYKAKYRELEKLGLIEKYGVTMSE